MSADTKAPSRDPTEGRSSWSRRSQTTAPPLGPRGLARWFWRQLTSMRTALMLLFLLSIAAIPGSLIPQQAVDPSAVAGFKIRHPSLTPLFERVGMFHVYSSVWFSAVYLLLMISLVGCIIPRARVYLKASRAQPPKAPSKLSRLSAYATWTSDRSRALEAHDAVRLLRQQRRRIQLYETDDETVISAEKGYLREAGNLVFHLAVLVVLVGVAITSLFGFKGSAAVIAGSGFSNTLPQYDQFTLGAWFNPDKLAPFSFAVNNFRVAYQETGPGAGTPLLFDANLSVTDLPGSQAYPYDLRVNDPLTVDGTSVFLVGHGYAPEITVRDARGNIAFSGPVVFLPQDGTFTSFGVIKAPDAQPAQLGFEGYFFPTAAITPQGQPYSAFPAAKNPVLVLTAYQGDLGLNAGIPQSVYVLDKKNLSPLDVVNGQPRPLLIRLGQTVTLPGGVGSVTFKALKPWVQLQISQEPGKLIPLVGVLAAIAGLLCSLFIRPRRTWIRLRDHQGQTLVEVAALDRAAGGDPKAHVAELTTTLRPAPAKDAT